MEAFGNSLEASTQLYPQILDANVSLFWEAGSEGFQAQESEEIAPEIVAMEAYLEASAFEMALVAGTFFPFPESVTVRIFVGLQLASSMLAPFDHCLY